MLKSRKRLHLSALTVTRLHGAAHRAPRPAGCVTPALCVPRTPLVPEPQAGPCPTSVPLCPCSELGPLASVPRQVASVLAALTKWTDLCPGLQPGLRGCCPRETGMGEGLPDGGVWAAPPGHLPLCPPHLGPSHSLGVGLGLKRKLQAALPWSGVSPARQELQPRICQGESLSASHPLAWGPAQSLEEYGTGKWSSDTVRSSPEEDEVPVSGAPRLLSLRPFTPLNASHTDVRVALSPVLLSQGSFCPKPPTFSISS